MRLRVVERSPAGALRQQRRSRLCVPHFNRLPEMSLSAVSALLPTTVVLSIRTLTLEECARPPPEASPAMPASPPFPGTALPADPVGAPPWPAEATPPAPPGPPSPRSARLAVMVFTALDCREPFFAPCRGARVRVANLSVQMP